MIVIIEGCDKTGKTTLSELFKAEGYEYRHFSAPAPGVRAFAEYKGFLDSKEFSKAMAEGRRFVLDRFHLGEVVYPAIVGRPSGMTQEERELLEAQLNAFGGVLVHATGDVGTVAKRFIDCKEESTRIDQIPQVLQLFSAAAKACRFPTVRYEAGAQSPEAVVRLVKGFHDSVVAEVMEAGAARLRAQEGGRP